MPFFRKKPVAIEAVKWTGDNLREIIDFTGLHPSANKWSWAEYEAVVQREGLKIFTLEGAMMASVGDWIIKGVKGEFYPCKSDIFVATYETVEPLTVGKESNLKDHQAPASGALVHPVVGPLHKDRPWGEYPIGTKAHALMGGYWIKVQNGWKWHNGSIFPTPGGEAIGACIELPNTTNDQPSAPSPNSQTGA